MKTMALVAVLAVLGCGGSGGGGGSCGKVQPCGGDIHGTWKLNDFCISDPAFLGFNARDLCDTATVTLAGSALSGTATFGADGTLQVDEVISLSMKVDMPASCVPAGTTCDQLAAALAPAGDAQVSSATCAPAGGGCTCQVASKPRTVTQSGTFTTSGTTLTQTRASDGVPSDVQYCVQGDTLHVITVDVGTKEIIGDVVGTRS